MANEEIDSSLGSKERVAYDLMIQICKNEPASEQKSREYWLTLYSQCRQVVRGTSVETVLSNKS